jgi:hypothetical protein
MVIDMRQLVLRIRGNFKKYSFSVPSYRRKKRVKDKDHLCETKEVVQAVPLIHYKNYIRYYDC